MKLNVFMFGAFVHTLTVTSAASDVCQTGIYAAFGILANYPPAEFFCSANFPPSTVTVKQRLRFARQLSNTPAALAAMPTISTTSTTTSTTSTATFTTAKTSTIAKTTTTPDAKATLWSSLEAEASGILSTFCSCIETHPTVSHRTTLSYY